MFQQQGKNCPWWIMFLVYFASYKTKTIVESKDILNHKLKQNWLLFISNLVGPHI